MIIYLIENGLRLLRHVMVMMTVSVTMLTIMCMTIPTNMLMLLFISTLRILKWNGFDLLGLWCLLTLNMLLHCILISDLLRCFFFSVVLPYVFFDIGHQFDGIRLLSIPIEDVIFHGLLNQFKFALFNLFFLFLHNQDFQFIHQVCHHVVRCLLVHGV